MNSQRLIEVDFSLHKVSGASAPEKNIHRWPTAHDLPHQELLALVSDISPWEAVDWATTSQAFREIIGRNKVVVQGGK